MFRCLKAYHIAITEILYHQTEIAPFNSLQISSHLERKHHELCFT